MRTSRTYSQVSGTKPQRSRKKAKTPPPKPTLYETFEQGDLIFGLLSVTNAIGDQLKNQGFHHVYSNYINCPTIGVTLQTGTKELDVEQAKHLLFLTKHKDYLAKQPSKPVPTMLDNPFEGGAYRRACKLLINNRDPAFKRKVHVITTDIDWARVFSKTKADGSNDIGVTNSEMRSAYRDYCRHGTNPNILFYNEKLELMPKAPWQMERTSELAMKYDAARARKQVGILETISTTLSSYLPKRK